jgi:cysteinyl-tRNA synthetase
MINGFKMSNSMGNVITIEEILKKYSPVHIRLFFLIHSWFSTLSYSDYGMDDAAKYEKMLNEFFLKVEPHLRSIEQLKPSNRIKFDGDDLKMNQCHLTTQQQIELALCDSIDTGIVMNQIRELIAKTILYMDQNKDNINLNLLKMIVHYIRDSLNEFGLKFCEISC